MTEWGRDGSWVEGARGMALCCLKGAKAALCCWACSANCTEQQLMSGKANLEQHKLL